VKDPTNAAAPRLEAGGRAIKMQQATADRFSVGTGIAEREVPTVTVLRVKPIRRPAGTGNRQVTIRCPFCRRLHFHGWPAGDPEIGHRLPHCVGKTIPNYGYEIEVPS
jgi:hypothetical protein